MALDGISSCLRLAERGASADTTRKLREIDDLDALGPAPSECCRAGHAHPDWRRRVRALQTLCELLTPFRQEATEESELLTVALSVSAAVLDARRLGVIADDFLDTDPRWSKERGIISDNRLTAMRRRHPDEDPLRRTAEDPDTEEAESGDSFLHGIIPAFEQPDCSPNLDRRNPCPIAEGAVFVKPADRIDVRPPIGTRDEPEGSYRPRSICCRVRAW